MQQLTRQAAHVGVGAKFGVNSQVSQMLLHHCGGQGAGVHAQAGSLLHIQLIHHLLKAYLHKPVTGNSAQCISYRNGHVGAIATQHLHVETRCQWHRRPRNKKDARNCSTCIKEIPCCFPI